MMDYEKEIRLGEKYEWVVAVRPDMEFVLPLPSNRVLQHVSSGRMPTGHTRALFFMDNNQNHMGVSDRFGILSRDAAPFYFQRLDFILNGSFSEIVQRKSCVDCNSERMLAMWMSATETTLIGLPGFGALLCPKPHDKPLGLRTTAPCEVQGFEYKYDDNNLAGEPSVMNETKKRFQGWNTHFRIPS